MRFRGYRHDDGVDVGTAEKFSVLFQAVDFRKEFVNRLATTRIEVAHRDHPRLP